MKMKTIIGNHNVRFIPSGRGKAQCPSNPAHPEGVHVDRADGRTPFCYVQLPYPAPECGTWHINCQKCGYSLVITAAGRPDDPRSVSIPCQIEETP